jgi:hypothetical protein
MGHKEAFALFVLFATQLFITSEMVRIYYAFAYAGLCVVLLVMSRKDLPVTAGAAWDIIRGKKDALEHQPASHAEP